MVEWTDEMDVLLLNSMRTLKPFGPERHFNMLQISKLFHRHLSQSFGSSASRSISVTNEDLWHRIGQLFDLKRLEHLEESRRSKARKLDSNEKGHASEFALEPSADYEDTIEDKIKHAAAETTTKKGGNKRKSRGGRRNTPSAASSPVPSESNQSLNDDEASIGHQDEDGADKMKIDTAPVQPVQKSKARGGRKSMPASTTTSASTSPKKTSRKSAIGVPSADTTASSAPSKSKKTGSTEPSARKTKRK